MNWTNKQRESFIIHIIIVAAPFIAGSVSAWLLWNWLFVSPWIASFLVGVIDVLALTGFVLYLRGTPSPFHSLRRVLPFMSFVPLGIEGGRLLWPNGWYIAVPVAIALTCWLIWIDLQCFATIERLFQPAEVARQQAIEGAQSLRDKGREAIETNAIIDGFVDEWNMRRGLPPPQAVYPRPAESSVIVPDSTITSAIKSDESKSQRVKAYAAAHGISIATAWRRVKADPALIESEVE